MPASLTNQIRLGFSLGWRIWTPNEVGFYARSLAHSYFINNVLTTKFLEKKIWIVNYSIFIAPKKYYVFLEYLQFGIKSKEERCYWKKLIYMTAEWGFNERSGANRRVNKVLSYYRYFSKMESARRSEKQRYPVLYNSLMGSVKDWVCLTITDILSKNPKQHNIEKAASIIQDKLNNSIMCGIAYTHHPFNQFYNLRGDLEYAENSIINNYQKYKDICLSFGSGFSVGTDTWHFRNTLIASASAIPTTLLSKNTTTELQESLEPCVKYSKYTPLDLIWRYDANVMHSNITDIPNAIKNDFRGIFDSNKSKILTPERQYSFFISGPRMRYFRNLKRSHASRHVFKYASLIWYWEKLARLISFHAKYHGGQLLFIK